MAILTTTQAGLNFVGGTTYIQTGTTTLMAIATNGNIQFSQYGAGTLVTDASGNITVSSGGGAGGPYLPVANPTFTGTLTGPIGSFTSSVSAIQFHATNNGSGFNYKIGDDAWIGDINVANTFRITGNQNNNNGYITFGNSSNAALGRAGTGPLTWGGDMTVSGVLQGQISANSSLVAGTGWNLNSTYLGQSIYSSGGGDNNGSTFDTARYKSAQLWGRSGTTWTDLGSAAAMLAGNNAQNYGTVVLTHNAYDEYIIFMGASLGYTFINNTTLTHSTQGNSMALYLESKESVTNPYEAGWTSITSITGISSWPGGTSITKSFGIGGGYDNNFRLRIVPTWSSNATNYNIGLGGLQMFASYGNPVCAYTTTWDDTNKNTLFHGKVGIGTTSPDYKLDVEGDISLVGAGENYAIMSPISQGMQIAVGDPADIATPLVTFDGANQRVGIGTTSPLGKLQVNEYTVASQGSQGVHGELSVFANSGDDSLFLGIKDAAYPNRGWSFNPVTNGVNSNLQFKEHGSTSVRMTIQSGGNVGIGTTNPTFKLHVDSADASDNVAYIHHNNAAQTSGDVLKVRSDAGDNAGSALLNVANNTGSALYVRGDRNVGIGTDSPGAKLEVEGDATADDTAQLIVASGGADNNAIIHLTDDAGGQVNAIGALEGNILTFASLNEMVFKTNTSSILGNTDTRMTIDTNGKVGIGTTSPVNGKLVIDSTANQIAIETGTAGDGRLNIGHFSNGTFIGTYGDDGGVADLIRFGTHSGDERMRITSSGNVGIGVTAPTVKLWVNQGNVTGTVIKASGIGAQIEIQSSTAGDAHLYMRPNTSSNKAAIFKMTAGTNYNWRWQDDAATPVVFMQLSQSNSSLSVKGDIIAYGAPSDERYKENIKPIESALDKAVKLQGVTFDWKESDSILDIKEDIGFIAQDVQKVVPELVRENEDGKLSLRYQGVTPILLEAIKELKAEIDLLKSKPCNCNNCNCSI
jgi:hypothetical protein